MENSSDKDKPKEKVVPITETTPDQVVTPIYNGKAQPECTFLEYVEDLPKSNPNTWSKI